MQDLQGLGCTGSIGGALGRWEITNPELWLCNPCWEMCTPRGEKTNPLLIDSHHSPLSKTPRSMLTPRKPHWRLWGCLAEERGGQLIKAMGGSWGSKSAKPCTNPEWAELLQVLQSRFWWVVLNVTWRMFDYFSLYLGANGDQQ